MTHGCSDCDLNINLNVAGTSSIRINREPIEGYVSKANRTNNCSGRGRARCVGHHDKCGNIALHVSRDFYSSWCCNIASGVVSHTNMPASVREQNVNLKRTFAANVCRCFVCITPLTLTQCVFCTVDSAGKNRKVKADAEQAANKVRGRAGE